MSIEWAINCGGKSINSKDPGKKKQLFICIRCDRLWESTGHRREVAYFTRSDLSFYGFGKKICKNCI